MPFSAAVKAENKSEFVNVGASDLPRFLVIQNGARHDYAVPAAFERAGALAAFYTDMTAVHGAGLALARVFEGSSRVKSRLARRTPPPEVARLTKTTSGLFLATEVLKSVMWPGWGGNWASRVGKDFAARIMSRRGTAGATHVYSMQGEGGMFLEEAQARGLGIVLDIYIAFSAAAIVAREAASFPDWSHGAEASAHLSDRSRVLARPALLDNCDLVVCPSEFVQSDLVLNYGVDPSKICIAPYAVNSHWLDLELAPETGRVLFAGAATLRKGIHYLARAATLLRGACEIRVAGGVSERVRSHPEAKHLTFLGHLGKTAMASEFARADVFAFPTLAEGAASVTAEALGAGVPVVTTKSAGSIVRDGIDGWIVPERDPEALASAVLSIVEDRDRRDAMSRAAREHAQAFTWDRFAAAVISATQRIEK